MTRRAGSADLPLHGGHVPKWLADRMVRLGAVLTEAVVHHYGRDEFLRRIAHPFWFQSFGAVMGMDWHSSGITTSVLGALKRGLAPLSGELGLHVCGGRGRHSRLTPGELTALGDRVGFDGGALANASRLIAKVDSAAVQDGFDLYLHGFIVSDEGRWTVVQQGMNGDRKQARRYHWLSEGLRSFVDEPHSAIEGRDQGRPHHPEESGNRARFDKIESGRFDRHLFEYDGIVMSSRNCIALLCLAVLCLTALTPAASHFLYEIVLPLCFVFSLAAVLGGIVETERKPLIADFSLLLPARAPPDLS